MGKRFAGFDAELRNQLRENTGNKCQECGKEGCTEIHHRLPIGVAKSAFPDLLQPNGGLDVFTSAANAEVLCYTHHRLRHERPQDYDAIAEELRILARARNNQ